MTKKEYVIVPNHYCVTKNSHISFTKTAYFEILYNLHCFSIPPRNFFTKKVTVFSFSFFMAKLDGR